MATEQPQRKSQNPTLRPEDVAKALAAHLPWKPPAFTVEDLGAVQACWRGDAMPHQQKRVLEFVIDLSRNDGALFFPGEGGRRDTDFALGRRFVGEQLVTMIKMRIDRGGEHG